MPQKIILKPQAENDLSEIFEWYENQRTGLGFDFLLQVDVGLRQIERNPYLFREQYKGNRRFLVQRFPYKVYYRIEADIIYVLAVIHGRRNPAYVKRRLMDE